jgi:methylenetetrahydrofolate dehydrogenase (NADP+)/methenyltetrahydrofolate cyclohydrolase
VISQIQKTANDNNVTGIMLQLPVPGLQGVTLKEVISAIPYDKDVDGLRYPESGVVPPVVKAVIEILTAITNLKFPARIASQNDAGGSNSQIKNLGIIVVVGAAGFVGSGVMEQLSQRGVTALGVERGDDMGLIKTGDIVISAVGEEGVIKPEMVKGGAVVIDVGAPKGDMTKEVYQKASVSVEVPGGVGPVTIAMLMANAVDLVVK